MSLASHSPYTGEQLGQVPVTAPEDVARVVEEVRAVQPIWAQLPAAERGRYLERAAQVVIDETGAIRDLICREQGKPRNEAFSMEVLPSIDALRWFGHAGPGILAEEQVGMPQPFMKAKRAAFVLEPLGVVGVVAPASLPWSVPVGHVATALMAGNGVVLKPSSLTPLTGELVRRVFERAGVPEGLVRVVHGPGTGRALVACDLGKVIFTGTVPTGRAVAEACARRLSSAVLELGGKDPMLVLDDAALDHAVACALWAGYANAGQTSAGVERIYVARPLAERFTEALVEGARRLRLGDPLAWETEIGPMIRPEQAERVRELVGEAVAAGAELRCGGSTDSGFFAPAVLTGVDHGMRIMREEIFGPVLTVMPFDTEEEAIGLANDCSYGLGASVWTGDRGRGELVAAELQAGMVWINDHLFSHGATQCSWGGVKQSGIGRTNSRYGLLECVNVKLRVWEPSRLPDVWWHPYDRTLGEALESAARILYGRPSLRAGAVRAGARPLLQVGRRLVRRRAGRAP